MKVTQDSVEVVPTPAAAIRFRVASVRAAADDVSADEGTSTFILHIVASALAEVLGETR